MSFWTYNIEPARLSTPAIFNWLQTMTGSLELFSVVVITLCHRLAAASRSVGTAVVNWIPGSIFCDVSSLGSTWRCRGRLCSKTHSGHCQLQAPRGYQIEALFPHWLSARARLRCLQLHVTLCAGLWVDLSAMVSLPHASGVPQFPAPDRKLFSF